jgi:threonine/homoserine/homoserine lactone efflux protein
VSALFFVASIFASTGVLSASPATGVAAVLGIIIGNGCYLSLLAWLMQRQGPRAFYARNRRVLQIIFGLVFIALGAKLVQRDVLAWF